MFQCEIMKFYLAILAIKALMDTFLTGNDLA